MNFIDGWNVAKARDLTEAEARAAIIAHQKAQLDQAERDWVEAVNSGDYDATQEAAKRCNRLRTALVGFGALTSAREADDEARANMRTREHSGEWVGEPR